jgi:hypothetical protein
MCAHSEKFGDGNLHLRLLHQGPADVEPLSLFCVAVCYPARSRLEMKVARERPLPHSQVRERGLGKAASEHLPKSRMGILSKECSAVVGRPGLVERGGGVIVEFARPVRTTGGR